MTREFDSIEDLKQYLNTVPDGFIIRLELADTMGGKENEDEEARKPVDGR